MVDDFGAFLLGFSRVFRGLYGAVVMAGFTRGYVRHYSENLTGRNNIRGRKEKQAMFNMPTKDQLKMNSLPHIGIKIKPKSSGNIPAIMHKCPARAMHYATVQNNA